jgi:hypothetical protein
MISPYLCCPDFNLYPGEWRDKSRRSRYFILIENNYYLDLIFRLIGLLSSGIQLIPIGLYSFLTLTRAI